MPRFSESRARQRTFSTLGEFAQSQLFCKELLDSEQNNLLPKALQRHVWVNRAALTGMKRPNHWKLFPDSRSRVINRQSCQLHLESPRAPAPSHRPPTSVNALGTQTWECSQSHPNDNSAVFCFLSGSFETSMFSVFLGFWLSLEQCLGELSPASHHCACSGVNQPLPFCLFPSSEKSQKCSSLPKPGSGCCGSHSPGDWHKHPTTDCPTHKGIRDTVFLAVTLELTPIPSILVQCLISGHNVWKLRFLHKVTVQWAGNSAVLLFLRYWKSKYGQYISEFLMEVVIEGLRSKMALDALESEMRVEMD